MTAGLRGWSRSGVAWRRKNVGGATAEVVLEVREAEAAVGEAGEREHGRQVLGVAQADGRTAPAVDPSAESAGAGRGVGRRTPG
jgi:hypothetical protein